MTINFLRSVDIHMAAEKSRLAALLMSKRHWRQMKQLGSRREYYAHTLEIGAGSDDCACCRRYGCDSDKCKNVCPLSNGAESVLERCCHGEYRAFLTVKEDFRTTSEQWCRAAEAVIHDIDKAIRRTRYALKKGEVLA